MCGIAGLWTQSPSPLKNKIIEDMNSALTHRGPDRGGFWYDPQSGLYLGHRRLSIIDLSESGAQPMTSPSGRYVMTYNGEFYNYQDIQKELAPHHPKYNGHSDTEVFLHAADHFGLEEAIEKVQGMFAFAIWDHKTQTLTLARDRFGKKPLYIGWAGNDLLFASELKSFHAHPDFEKRVNDGSRFLYMQYGYIPAPNTIFEGVWHLPPGCLISLDANNLEPRTNIVEKMTPYWSCTGRAQIIHKRKSLENEHDMALSFQEKLEGAVQRRMISDVPLGAFLSGGIDSSLITALMQHQTSTSVKTFSIGFDQDSFDEAPFAKQIAAHLKTDHTEFYVSGIDALNIIPDLHQIYDEPFADISAIPTILLSRLARQEVTVALSGDGGDEMMGGYTRHINAPHLFQMTSNVPHLLKNLVLKYKSRLSPALQNKFAKAAPFLSETNKTHLFQKLLFQSAEADHWTGNGAAEEFALQKFKFHTDIDLSFAEYMMLGDTLHALPHKFLTKVDRASMAASLEVRSPFLDKNVFEYAWTLPLEVKIRGREGKWLLREILKKFVPEALFDRPKQGFNIPLQTWLNRDLKGWAEDLLSPQELEANGFHPEKILRAWAQHKKGHTANTNRLWALCLYQAWARKWTK